jgi:hypothetical protein
VAFAPKTVESEPETPSVEQPVIEQPVQFTPPVITNGPATGTETPQTVEQAQPLIINSIAPINDINVANGTALSIAGLPATITATLSDSTTKDLTITWDNGTPAYSENNAGTYNFVGTLTLVDNIENPNNRTATANIIVAEPPLSAESENQPSTGDIIQDTASALINGVIKFSEYIVNSFFQQSSKLIPKALKKTTANLTSYVKEDVKSDLQQIFSQMKKTGDLVISPVNKLLGR